MSVGDYRDIYVPAQLGHICPDSPQRVKPLLISITIKDVKLSRLLHTGASDCFMTTRLAKRLGLKINRVFNGKVAMSDKELKSEVKG